MAVSAILRSFTRALGQLGDARFRKVVLLGVGLSLALSADFRFAVRTAKITCAFSKLGLTAEHGTSFRLPRLVGTGRAMLLLMSSDVITAEEGERIGLSTCGGRRL